MLLTVLTWCGAWSLLPLRVFGITGAGAQHPLALLPSAFGPGGAAAIFCRSQWSHLTWPPLPQRAFTPQTQPLLAPERHKINFSQLPCAFPSLLTTISSSPGCAEGILIHRSPSSRTKLHSLKRAEKRGVIRGTATFNTATVLN